MQQVHAVLRKLAYGERGLRLPEALTVDQLAVQPGVASERADEDDRGEDQPGPVAAQERPPTATIRAVRPRSLYGDSNGGGVGHVRCARLPGPRRSTG